MPHEQMFTALSFSFMIIHFLIRAINSLNKKNQDLKDKGGKISEGDN